MKKFNKVQNLKVDKVDKKILKIISENPRISYTDLGKQLGLKKNTAKYRLDKLLEKAVWKIVPIVNYRKLKLITYDVFLKCNLSKSKKLEFETMLSKHDNILWATELFGKWNYYIEFLCKDVFEFDSIMTQMNQFLGTAFQEYDMLLMTERLYLRQLLPELTKDVDFEYQFKWNQPNYDPIELDKLDKKILSLLCKNGRMPHYEIAVKTKVTLPTITNRINKMVENTVITKFSPIMMHVNFGYSRNFIHIKTHNFTQAEKIKLKKWFNQETQTKHVLRASNSNDLLIYACFRSQTDLENYIIAIRNQFHNIIRDVNILKLTNEFKLDFFPKGLL
jgi:Lrp/AsnC family transcriptional regulator, leucine-responsive regulatory protein